VKGSPGTERVAIIGAGVIARGVGEAIRDGAVPGFSLVGFLTRRPADNLPAPQARELGELLPAAVVVESAGRDAVAEHGVAVLETGAELVCCSVGALGDAALRERLLAASARGGSRVVVPSGAVGGLDLLSAAREAGLEEVVVEQRKPPRALLAESEAAALDEPAVVFDGTVAEVVERFPRTTNVAAAVALAGLGFELTRARVVADPALGANEVRVTARGAFGTFELSLANVASADPRTSMIVAHSIVATLRRRHADVIVPG